MLPEIQTMVISEEADIYTVLQAIDATAQGIVFIVDDNGTMTGVITDGDVRRALLRGVTLNDSVVKVMNQSFVARPIGVSNEELLALLSLEKVKHIPLLDDKGRPVDYACVHRLRKIQVSQPLLTGNELAYVTECIRKNWISSQGMFVKQFEKMFSGFCGMEEGLAVSNGTVALHLALLAFGIEPGDEVIVPDFTFAATINAVLYTGATPVLVDVDDETWTMDPQDVERAITNRTRAIMPVHLYGQSCRMDELMEIARKEKILVVEDCAEAVGTQYKDSPVGGFGDAAGFSFYGNKTITTGEGGMVLFKDREIAEKARCLRDHGMDQNRRYWHDHVGYNYRMTNIQAAIGVAQMERVSEFVAAKKAIGNFYTSALRDIHGIRTPPMTSWGINSYWLYTVIVDSKEAMSRDEMIAKLLLNGIETRPVFYPLHVMTPYQQYSRGKGFPVTEHLSRNGLSLPSAVSLTTTDMNHVASSIRSILGVRSLVKG